MFTYKKHPIIILPASKSVLGLDDYNYLVLSTDPDYGFEEFNKEGNFRHRPFHLYILSNESIKDGDIIFSSLSQKVFKYIKNDTLIKKGIYFKILASTDKSLGVPLIHLKFVKEYTDSYNTLKRPTEVTIQYQNNLHWGEIMDDSYPENFFKEELYINNNEVNISLFKDITWRDIQREYSAIQNTILPQYRVSFVDWLDQKYNVPTSKQ